jgi:predicted nucleic acid-binding protein
MTDRAFFDTNVNVYLFDVAEPEKRAMAMALLQRPLRFEPVFSAQVLSEFFTVTTHKLKRPLTPLEATEAIRDFARMEVVPVDTSLVLDAIRLRELHRLSYWDSLILAAAIRGRCEILLSEDFSHGAVLSGVRIKNPFRGLR